MSDTLIFAMSTRGSMKLEHFNELFRRVYFPSAEQVEESVEIDIRRQVVRILDSLGYCEFDFEGRMVYMCKPSLVLLPFFGLPKALLVGARSPALVTKLKESVRKYKDRAVLKTIVHAGVNSAIPVVLCIEAIDVDTIEKISQDIKISCDKSWPASWALANVSSSVEDVKSSLKFENIAEPNWKRRVFLPNRLGFSSIKDTKGDCFLGEYKHPITQQLHHLLWKDGSAAKVGRDWGRYIYLAGEATNILLFNDKLQKLAVPVTVPLPCILARAIALCTGIAPVYATVCSKQIEGIPAGHSVQVYSGITPVIARLVAEKLGQKLIYTRFEIDKDGILHA